MSPYVYWGAFLLLQNASFTFVSRARNSASYLLHATAAVCSNGVCDSSGACVACIIPADCATPACVGATCLNSSCELMNAAPYTPDPTCSSGSACDGNGNCKKVDGQVCAIDVECISGFCCMSPGPSKQCQSASC